MTVKVTSRVGTGGGTDMWEDIDLFVVHPS